VVSEIENFKNKLNIFAIPVQYQKTAMVL
jgi:hypothetical protein